jgi:hypothetical protein
MGIDRVCAAVARRELLASSAPGAAFLMLAAPADRGITRQG